MRRPAFTQKELRYLIAELRQFEKTGTKRRTQEIRKLLRDYVHFVLMTGARPGTELYNLKWSDIDSFIDVDEKEYLLIHVDGKTGARQLVASTRLRRYLNRLKRRQKGSPFVFALPDGSRPKDLHGAFELFLRSIGLLYNAQGQRYSLYSLRHCYATSRLLRGVDIESVSLQMGTSPQMIRRHYRHITPMIIASQLV